MLTEAGWTDSDGNGVLDKKVNGKTVETAFQALVLSGNPVSEQLATSVQGTFKKVGIKIDLVFVDLTKMFQLTSGGTYDMAFNQSALQPGLVELYQGYHSSQLAPKGDNRSRIALPELDKAIEMIRYTEDPAARLPHYIDAQRILHEYAPEIYLHSPRTRYVISKRLNYNQSSVPPGYYEQYFSIK